MTLKIKNHVLVNGCTIGHATVVSNRIEGKGYGVPGYSMNPKYITIHNVGDDDVPGKNWYNAMHNANKTGFRTAGWHATVDYNTIYQSVAFNQCAWHAGDGKNGTGNRYSIGIEHCQYSKDKEKQRMVWENSIALCKEIMKVYPISLNHVVQHYYWTKKDCPYLLRHKRFGYDWSWYINQFKEKTQESTDTTNYIIKVIVDELNVRKTPGIGGELVLTIKEGDVYTIVEEKIVNGGTWGKLKSGVGWINVNSKYVKKL